MDTEMESPVFWIVLAVLIAVLYFAIVEPIMYAPVGSTESGAIANLRTISSAEELYTTKNGTYCSLGDLYALGAYIDQSLSTAVDTANAKAGYYYTLVVSGSGDKWCCVARPSAWGSTGTRNFKIDQTGAIYYNTTDGGSNWTAALGS